MEARRITVKEVTRKTQQHRTAATGLRSFALNEQTTWHLVLGCRGCFLEGPVLNVPTQWLVSVGPSIVPHTPGKGSPAQWSASGGEGIPRRAAVHHRPGPGSTDFGCAVADGGCCERWRALSVRHSRYPLIDPRLDRYREIYRQSQTQSQPGSS